MRAYVQALIAATLATMPISIAAKPRAPASMSAEEQRAVQQSLDRGTLLYRFDQAAWHTTDALLKALGQERAQAVRGWVVTEEVEGDRATYYGRDGNTPYLIYSAVWDGEKIISSKVAEGAAREPLSAAQLELVAAIDATRPLADKKPHCTKDRLNTVALPRDRPGGPVSVYFLTPQPSAREIAFGGHYRFDVMNGRVVSQRAFAKSCAIMPKSNLGAQAFVITHLLDSIPTEIHVFNHFTLGMPIYVGVTDGRIYNVDQKDGQPRVRIVDQP
ncbi:MAG: hypothetical protein ABIQ32_07155 [Sphingomicrobium sp.]